VAKHRTSTAAAEAAEEARGEEEEEAPGAGSHSLRSEDMRAPRMISRGDEEEELKSLLAGVTLKPNTADSKADSRPRDARRAASAKLFGLILLLLTSSMVTPPLVTQSRPSESSTPRAAAVAEKESQAMRGGSEKRKGGALGERGEMGCSGR